MLKILLVSLVTIISTNVHAEKLVKFPYTSEGYEDCVNIRDGIKKDPHDTHWVNARRYHRVTSTAGSWAYVNCMGYILPKDHPLQDRMMYAHIVTAEEMNYIKAQGDLQSRQSAVDQRHQQQHTMKRYGL